MAADGPIQYVRPPITEAVIGINVADASDERSLKDVSEKLAKHYPLHQPLQNLTLHIQVKAKGSKAPTGPIAPKAGGHRLSTRDMTEIAVVMPGQFVVSQLAPYPSWEVFSKRFHRDWHIWKRCVGHLEIKRIGVRYINRIDIPVENSLVHHEDYLSIYPHVPELLDPIGPYAIQMVSQLTDINCKLTINSSAIVNSILLNHQSFVIDIDIAKEVDVPQSDHALFELLETIRQKKNQVFEASITQKARNELFGVSNNVK